MNKKRPEYIKIIRLLISNDKKIFLISALSSILGFAFLFTISSLSETIIETKQDNTLNTYGKFLMVIPDISKDAEENIKSQCSKFTYEQYGVYGNLKYADKIFTMGTMREDMGKTLGFHLIKGKWPNTPNQIVIEEYMLYLFGIENKDLPVSVSFTKENIAEKYEVTGVISNYSYLLTTSNSVYQETKAYPSVICGQDINQRAKKTLVAVQKKTDFKNAPKDIDFLLSNISMNNNVCINEKLYGYGYKDNEDIIYTRIIYIIILNILLLSEQIVLIRAFLLRNKKTIFLLGALGMNQKERRKLLSYLINGLLWLCLIIGYLLALLVGSAYVTNTFGEYSRFYTKELYHSIITEIIIVMIISLISYFLDKNTEEISVICGMTSDISKKQKKYKFKKLDFSMVIAYTVCILFTMASFYCTNAFQTESGNSNYDLCSKRETITYPLKEYDIAVYGDNFFSFDSFDSLNEYADYISISAEAETKQSSILVNKNNTDSYFQQFYEKNDDELTTEDMALWKQVSDDAESYNVISQNNLEIIVLPQKDFYEFLKKNRISSHILENNKERACVLLLPNYKKSVSNSDIKEKGMLQLGGIQGNRKHAEFFKEGFKIESLLSYNERDCCCIQVVMSEETARKSKTVIGYDSISIVVKNDAPLYIRKEIEQKVMILMASMQGGMLTSSELRNNRENLSRNYISVMSNTMLFFCIIVIYIYIVLNTCIDWEKNRYEYGVLRSFGMSYSTLQSKLFIRYGNSIAVACIFSMILGRYAFMNELLTRRQILASVALTVGVTCLCRVRLFFHQKKQQISAMLYQ